MLPPVTVARTRAVVFAISLTILFSARLALPVLAKDEGDELTKGDPIPVEGVLTLDAPENIAAARAGLPHTRVVGGLYQGMRIAMPTNVDGSCNLDTLIGVYGTPEDRVEFDPDNRHWTQHDIRQAIGWTVDETTCEVVITLAQARDRTRRRIMHRLPDAATALERFNRHHPGADPQPAPTPMSAEPQSSIVDPRGPRVSGLTFTPCYFYWLHDYVRRTEYAMGIHNITYRRARNIVQSWYIDYPFWPDPNEDKIMMPQPSLTEWAYPNSAYSIFMPQTYFDWHNWPAEGMALNDMMVNYVNSAVPWAANFYMHLKYTVQPYGAHAEECQGFGHDARGFVYQGKYYWWDHVCYAHHSLDVLDYLC